jgi:RNA polymerase sigma-70 factor (ECF subfamily)
MTEPRDPGPSAVAVHGRVSPGGAIGRTSVGEHDLTAWMSAIYDAHSRDLFGFASALVRDPDAADDLVAEAFLRLVRETREDRAPDDPRAWLYRVVANLSLSRGRRLRTAQRFVRHLVDRRVGEPADERMLRSELQPELVRALMALGPDARAAVVMAARDCSGRDIAAALGRSETSARTLLHRARIDLRARLSSGDDR